MNDDFSDFRQPSAKALMEARREQRRYEIAKDVLAGFAACPSVFGGAERLPGIATGAVQWADALLDALEKPAS